MVKKFNVEVFKSIPKGLKKADYVDMLLFLSSYKPCVRLGCSDSTTLNEMIKWCESNLFKYCLFEGTCLYIANHKWYAYLTMKVDNSLYEHTYLLGRLLGYPKCCSQKASKIGEENLDQWEMQLTIDSVYSKNYSLINPSGYIKGNSLISHIPCSSNCDYSLKIAQDIYNIINEYKDLDCFTQWSEWFS